MCTATARCLAGKLGAQPDRVLLALMNDRMVAKGTILQWATSFFQDFLATEPMDELVAVLRKARIDSRLLELFPPQKRTLADFEAHFKVGAPVRRCPSLTTLGAIPLLSGHLQQLRFLYIACSCSGPGASGSMHEVCRLENQRHVDLHIELLLRGTGACLSSPCLACSQGFGPRGNAEGYGLQARFIAMSAAQEGLAANPGAAGVQAADLPGLVEYNNKKVAEVHMSELTTQLTAAVTADPPLPVEEVVASAQQKKQEWDLPDVEIVKVPPCSCQFI